MSDEGAIAKRTRKGQPRSVARSVAILGVVVGCGSDPGVTRSGNAPTLSVDRLDLEAYFGGPPTGHTVDVDNAGTVLEVQVPEPVPWLNVQPADYNSSSASFVVNVSSNATDLPESRYETRLRFVGKDQLLSGIPGSPETVRGYVEIPVTYTIRDEPHLDTEELSFRVSQHGAAEPQVVQLYGSRTPWTVHATEPWVTFSDAKGGPGSTNLSVGVDPAKVPARPGVYHATVQARAGDHESNKLVVNLTVDALHFVLPVPAVAFSSTVERGHLTHEVPILDDATGGVPWVASTDAPWLKLGATTGTTGDILHLEAVIDGVEPGFYESTVSILRDSGRDSAIELPADAPEPKLLAVSLYVTGTPQKNVAMPVEDSANVVADPLRPYAYVTHGAPGLDVYDIYEGTLVDTVSSPATPALDAMVATADGSRLYAVDRTTRSIAVVDLRARTLSAVWPGPHAAGGDCGGCSTQLELASVRCGGRSLLLAQARDIPLQIIDGDTGDVLSNSEQSTPWYHSTAPRILPAPAGDRVYVAERGLSGAMMGLYVVELRCTELAGAPLAVTTREFDLPLETVRDMIIAPDGSSVCMLGIGIDCVDTTTHMVMRHLDQPFGDGNVAFGPTGTLYGTSWQFGGITGGVFSYDLQTGMTGENVALSGIPARKLAISGDGLRVITDDDPALLEFVTVPP